jgi:hypothetical protein
MFWDGLATCKPLLEVMYKDFYNNVFTASAIFLAMYGLFMV